MKRGDRIRRAGPADLQVILELDRGSGLSNWDPSFWNKCLDDPLHFVLVWEREAPGGYSLTRAVAGQAELLRIAVKPELRRQGIGAVLLKATLDFAESLGCEKCFLEVRPSNRAAVQLYLTAGFREAGRRAGYYSHPDEDALVMSVELSPRHGRESAPGAQVP